MVVVQLCKFTKNNWIGHFFLIEVELIYNAVPISAVQQSVSVIHIETFVFKYSFP